MSQHHEPQSFKIWADAMTEAISKAFAVPADQLSAGPPLKEVLDKALRDAEFLQAHPNINHMVQAHCRKRWAALHADAPWAVAKARTMTWTLAEAERLETEWIEFEREQDRLRYAYDEEC